MNRHLVRAHRSEALWDSRPAGLSPHQEPERKSVRWAGERGVWGKERAAKRLPTLTPLLAIYIHLHFPQVRGKLCMCVQRGHEQVGTGLDLKGLFESFKQANYCFYGTWAESKWTQCTQDTREGCNCAPIRTCAAHSLTQSGSERRVQI